MFKKITFLIVLLIVTMSFVSTSYAWRPTGSRNYGNFEKLDQKAYTYDVAWYENTNGTVTSWINSDGSTRFPITVTDLDGSTRTYNTKADFVNDIIVPSMNEFNNKMPGYSFSYSGSTYGTSSDTFKVNDGKSVIQVYRQVSNNGGGYAWWSGLGYDEFGYCLYVGNSGSEKKWNIFAFRHEFIHSLYFSHKKEDLFGTTHTGNPFYSYGKLGCNLTDGVGNNIFRELNEDTMSGIDEVYNTGNYNLTLYGYVNDEYSTGYAEAYLIDESTHKIIYQAPIDTNGFYRFRLIHANFPTNFRLLVGNNKTNEAYYGTYIKYNSVGYLCILDHTSSTSNQPPNSTYWVQVYPIGGQAVVNGFGAWESGKNYKARQSIKWNYSNVYTKSSPGSYSLDTMSMSRTSNSLSEIENVSGIQMLYE